MKGIRDAKDLNAMADHLAHRGKAGRASSNAPASPAPKGDGAAKVKQKAVKAKMPEPAKSDGSVDTGSPTKATQIIVNHHHHYTK